MPPEMMRKLRAAGPQGAQKMMQDMMGGGGAPGAGPGGMDIGSMMKSMMGGGGGGGGMPNMAQMQGRSHQSLNVQVADECRSHESYGRRRGRWNAWYALLL